MSISPEFAAGAIRVLNDHNNGRNHGSGEKVGRRRRWMPSRLGRRAFSGKRSTAAARVVASLMDVSLGPEQPGGGCRRHSHRTAYHLAQRRQSGRSESVSQAAGPFIGSPVFFPRPAERLSQLDLFVSAMRARKSELLPPGVNRQTFNILKKISRGGRGYRASISRLDVRMSSGDELLGHE